MAYLWKIPPDYPDELIAEHIDIPFKMVRSLKKGQHLSENGLMKFRVKVNKTRVLKLHYVANSTLLPLISQRLAEEFLEHCKNEVQLMPSEISCEDGVMKNYFVVNILKLASVIDLESSDYFTVTGTKQPSRFKKVVLKKAYDLEGNIARDLNHRTSIFVSCFLREVLMKNKFNDLFLLKV